MKINELPTIFIFDFDGTLIGDANPYLDLTTFFKFIKDSCKNKDIEGDLCNIKIPTINKYISPNIFRPGLKEGFQQIKKYYPTAEFFIFSLGTQQYINTYIKFLQNHTGITINKPYFTRENASLSDSHNYLKLINLYFDTIIHKLTPKYNNINDNIEFIKNNRTIIIDDNSSVWNNDFRLINCPKYKYYPFIEIDEKILNLIYNYPYIQSYLTNNNNTTLPPLSNNNKTFEEYKLAYYLYQSNLYNKYINDNNESLKDTFIIRFANIIKKHHKNKKPFTSNSIKSINELLKK
jgi:hypothetical protein